MTQPATLSRSIDSILEEMTRLKNAAERRVFWEKMDDFMANLSEEQQADLRRQFWESLEKTHREVDAALLRAEAAGFRRAAVPRD